MNIFFHRILTNPDGFKELIPLINPTCMMYLGGSKLTETLILWNFIVITASFFFGWIGINAAHHHPQIFHDGDKPR